MSSPGRRFLCAITAVVCIAVTSAVGAARPAPAPTPSPTASPTPVPVNPVVLVYPFEIQGELPPKTGSEVAQIFAQQIAAPADETTLPIPAGVLRADYLSNARKSGADYYVSGFLTPLGDGASLVQQVVSVQTGIQVWSRTAMIQNTGDAQAQAELAHEAILVYSGRNQASVDQSDDASATPTPSADNGSSMSINNLFGLLKHGKSAPKGTYNPPAQVADANKPSRIIIVTRVAGAGISGEVLTSATQTLTNALSRAYHTQVNNVAFTTVAASASTICGANRNATITDASLSQTNDRHAATTFDLDIYTCFGASMFHTEQTAGSLPDAINAAAAAYAANHASNS